MLAFGTNAGTDEKAIRSVLTQLGPNRMVVIVTEHGRFARVEGDNAKLREIVKDMPNVRLADWDAALAGTSGQLQSDGIHPSLKGAHLYAKTVRQAFADLSQAHTGKPVKLKQLPDAVTAMGAKMHPWSGRVRSPSWGASRSWPVLRDALDAAAQGWPCGVLVAGNAGIGKSRLLAALREAVPPEGLLLAAQCVDLGDPGLAFLTVTDLLRGVRVRAEEAPEVAAVLRTVPVLDELGSGTNRPDDGADASHRLRVLDATATLLGDLGRVTGPVVVTVEDLQWVDDSSAAFLSFLLSRVTTERLLVVASVRTDGLAARPRARRLVGELGRLPAVHRIDLAPFDVVEVAGYLAQVRGVGAATDLDDDLVQEVFRRTGGNPFFVATLCADVARSGSLGEDVPAGLADLLVGQLERLPEAVRTVLRCAATSDRPVSDPVLRAMAGLDDPALEAALRAAVAEGVLVPRGPAYRLPHELLRAAVLDDLLPGERARLHAARAAALVGGLDGAPSPAEVAHHCAEAGDASGVLVWSVRAAEEALGYRPRARPWATSSAPWRPGRRWRPRAARAPAPPTG